MSADGPTPIDLDMRPGEAAVEPPAPCDAGLVFIGRIRTPWRERRDCPRRGDAAGPLCRIEVDALWRPALEGLKPGAQVQILYWMHRARRDLVLQSPSSNGAATGTFALRSPVRPNPIASSDVLIEDLGGDSLLVRGLDCIDGTPLLDIKPSTCPQWRETP
jgi:tRNA-Thr(GGU) m(6)t(6)A37 methyltransferase TsaA